MALGRWLGLEPGDAGPASRLGAVVGLSTVAEFVTEGALLSAFLARVGAESLPVALALRALVEVVGALAYDRATRHVSMIGASRGVAGLAATVLFGAALITSSVTGAYVAFVAVSLLARLRVIHFGVLALSELPRRAAERALPVVYGCARLGAIVSGALLTSLVPRFGVATVLAFAGVVQASALLVLLRRFGPQSQHEAPPSSTFGADEYLPPVSSRTPAAAGTSLLAAILVGAIALAFGRLALTTMSGRILEANFGEADLARVLGIYFIATNAVALLIQLGLVGRVLARGGLPWLNLGWAVLYLGAQLALAFGPGLVAIALAARAVESELRNTLRTPVANLLYEAIPSQQRARARTLVIGVAIPVASLLGGLGLAALGTAHPALAGLGLLAAIVLCAASWSQNRAFARATPARDARD